MSWLSRGTSNTDLIRQMQAFGAIKSERVANVMREVDRGLFVPPSEDAYQDAPQPIGFNATISAPHMHAHCLELLENHLKPGARALDVGSGTGYLTACMGLMVKDEGGKVVGVEHIKELTEKSKQNVHNSAAGPLLEQGVIELHTGDGRKGWPPHALYDAIHVGAAAEDTPKELLNQLKPGGRLVCPVGNVLEQYLMVYDKADDGSVREHTSSGVRYVPLTNEQDQRRPRGIFR
ncbi:Protein-L-isoaspartate(D-aspartate) O-methyltransferase [Klebsormidium nitens]|uniref:Protein-L-isoaspartate O-methyltransferase n=1 Tax=Klebsormidium nitens TaxID=105231 RepID=A0A1Y1HX17_KLENI|nr:Protein-L-isoaspartate(D-aspartate) O-methyltransferase [Klebsormidium nitens]|eukprot:GAQ83185.1 Protein-L-isoaspartate(D-aspartate) O-methyltransferase [Klebsormidium nitens]